MTQVNNNAESLSRELRKFKNIKSVDFRGLLSGNSESYVSLYRHLICENNIFFARYIVDKGYDLSSLSDYKFMEAVYKMMRDLFNLKPPINQNQFFTQGFTQRKLEMSTMLATHIRKVTYDLNSRTNKKTVQTQSLMKSSLKRSNSAPKPARVTELGDDEDERNKPRGYSALNNGSYRRPKKTKLNSKGADRHSSIGAKPKSHLEYKDADDEDLTNNISSDQSEKSVNNGNHYNYNSIKISDSAVPTNSHDNRTAVSAKSHYYAAPGSQYGRDHMELTTGAGAYGGGCAGGSCTGGLSAYESAPFEYDPYVRPPHRYGGSTVTTGDCHDQRGAYDVNHYTPRSDDETNTVVHRPVDRGAVANIDRITQQLETALARITLLESRMQRMESRYDNNCGQLQDRQPTAQPFYSNQNNQNYQHFAPSHNYHDVNKFDSYTEKTAIPIRDSRNVISDFESNYQGHMHKNDSDRVFTTVGANTMDTLKHTSDKGYPPHYGTNSIGSLKDDLEYRPYHAYGKNTTGSYRSNLSTDTVNGNAPKHFNSTTNYSDKRSLDANSSSRETSFRANSSKSSQPPIHNKISNGIPPIHPAMKKSDDSGFDENRHGKANSEKGGDSYIKSQTDRIASLLSDTQKMLRISDEEL